MLRTVNPNTTLWEAILPECCLGVPAGLAGDALLACGERPNLLGSPSASPRSPADAQTSQPGLGPSEGHRGARPS